MDINLNDVFVWVAGAAVTGYTRYVHSRMNKLDERQTDMRERLSEKYVAKEDYRSDMQEIKDVLREMRGDVKAILGVPER